MKINYDKNTRYDSRDTRYEFEVAKNIKRNIIKKNFQLGRIILKIKEVMVPVIHNIGMVTSFNLNPVWWALSLGACLGGNATFIAAAANLVGVNILKRQHIVITFKDFLRVGFPVMLISIVLSSIYLFLRYLL